MRRIVARYTGSMTSEAHAESRVEAHIHGRVQGVFFRHHTRLQALQCGLRGTVENLPNGTVRVVANGPRDKLEELVGWLRHGPELAHVAQVNVQWLPVQQEVEGFRIIR